MIKSLPTVITTIVLSFTFSLGCFAQKTTQDILDDYADYTETPRELAYAHLNKSTYVEGEMLGFAAYVFDKNTKAPSKITKNLYCTIENQEGVVLKQKLLKVEDGVTANVFQIDSTLTTGTYTFKAFTNWMRNFDEPNHFQHSFKVIDADNLERIKPVLAKDLNMDLQVLGEGGHIAFNLNNVVGIIAKNQFGLGVAQVNSRIVDQNNNIVSSFQLNDVGLAKTIFNPKPSNKYFVEIDIFNDTIKKEINGIKPIGLAMTLNTLNANTTIKLQANELFYQKFGDKTFKIALHNGEVLKLSEFKLNQNGSVILSYPKDQLFKGMNIFTIFSQDNKPLLERLHFNALPLDIAQVNNPKLMRDNDSLDVSLSINDYNPNKWSNVSISVLPKNTKSYNHHNNIISQIYIQPYVNGYIQNAKQYFKNTNQSQYNLDLLLLTQGWSSYDWNNIFNFNQTLIHNFEQGIDVIANINGEKAGDYLVYPMDDSGTQVFDIKKDDKSFKIKESYPKENDLLRVAYIKRKGLIREANIAPQYFPSEFPSFNFSYDVPTEAFLTEVSSSSEMNLDISWLKGEILEEVVIEGNSRYTEFEKLNEKAFSKRHHLVPDNIKNGGMRLDIYLQRLGWLTNFDILSGRLTITNPRTRGIGTQNPVPAVYIDGALIGFGPEANFDILTFIPMRDIDYIEYDLYGFGGGLLQGESGYIKIFTKPDANVKTSGQNVKSYDFPIKFSDTKTFYTPKYQFYNTAFFNEYGTIDWIPNVSIDNNGIVDLRILDVKNDVTLFIEGVVNGSQLVSQIIPLEMLHLN